MLEKGAGVCTCGASTLNAVNHDFGAPQSTTTLTRPPAHHTLGQGLCVSLSGPLAGLASNKSRDNLSALGKAAGSMGSRLDGMGPHPSGETAETAEAGEASTAGEAGAAGVVAGMAGGVTEAAEMNEAQLAAQAQLLKDALRLQAQQASGSRQLEARADLAVGTEDLLPLMAYALVRARLPHVVSELRYIEAFTVHVEDRQVAGVTYRPSSPTSLSAITSLH